MKINAFKKDEAARISKSIKYSDMQLSLLFFQKSVGRDEYFMEKSLSTCLHNSSYFHLGKVSFRHDRNRKTQIEY